MANQLPEVQPDVHSMPTTGWFCQTSGNARIRVTDNVSESATQGVFLVKGVPGHTHNASAVISVDADYTSYRKTAITVPENVWAQGVLAYPVGMLTDSQEPDNAEERYDRAIEKCVGEMSLFPENCSGHIREPTRSIGEIRTLVAPKARLDTLTYIDETRGWRVPNDEHDHKEEGERDTLVSDFPDVFVSLLPRTNIQNATMNKEISPSSVYLELEGDIAEFYRIEASDGAHLAIADLGTLAGTETRWAGGFKFVWDPDRRPTQKEHTITLDHVRRVDKNVAGALVGGAGAAALAFDGVNLPKISVTFCYGDHPSV